MKKGYWLLAALVVLGYFLDSMWTTSIDLPHHYALVARLAEHFTLPKAWDASLGTMNIYPHGSHFLAAILGMLTGSNLLGMHVLSLLALLIVWGGLVWLFMHLPNPNRWWALGLLAAILLLNRRVLLLPLHGDEIIGNYFFAQLVAQAGMVIALLLAFFFDYHERVKWRRNLMLTVLLWVLCFVHLLPVLELLGLFILLKFRHSPASAAAEKVKNN